MMNTKCGSERAQDRHWLCKLWRTERPFADLCTDFHLHGTATKQI